MNLKQEAALRELSSLGSPTVQLEALRLIEEKRREREFVKYWKPYAGGKQLEVFQQFTEEKKIIGILGGNRSGKTEEGAFIAVAWLLGKEYFRGEPAWDLVKDLPIPEGRPRTIWVIGLDFPTVRDVIWREKLRSGKEHPAFLPTDSPAVKKINDSDFQIFSHDGSILTCKSADSGREKFQGASVDLAWFDEECDEEVFDETYQRTVSCGGKILLTLTPLRDIASGVHNPWVWDLYQEWKAGNKEYAFIALSVLDNPYVPEIEKTRLKEKWAGHYEERARLYGEFIQRSGLVYNQWDDSKHLIRPISVSRDWKRLACIDPASTGPTACLWAAVAPNGDLYFYREYKEANLTILEHAKNIQVLNAGDQINIWLIDPKYGSQRNAETHKTVQQLYRDAGIPVRLAVVGEDYGLNTSREYIGATVTPNSTHPRAYFCNDLVLFRDERGHYVWDFFQAGEQKGLSKDKPRKRNDDLLNCFQYICAQRPRPRLGQQFDLSDEAKRQRAAVESYT